MMGYNNAQTSDTGVAGGNNYGTNKVGLIGLLNLEELDTVNNYEGNSASGAGTPIPKTLLQVQQNKF